MILFDTGLSPRAVPGLLRNDPLARFTDEDLLVHRLDLVGSSPIDVDLVVLSHLHYDHAGGAALFPKSELVVQKDEYAYAHYPAPFFESFYYRKNFDLPGYRWRLLDGDTELVPGVTVLRDRRAHARPPVLAGRAARDGAGHPHRRRLLLEGARRQGARARRRLEPGAGAALAQEAEDDRAAHTRRASSRVTTRSSGKPSSRRRTPTAESQCAPQAVAGLGPRRSRRAY